VEMVKFQLLGGFEDSKDGENGLLNAFRIRVLEIRFFKVSLAREYADEQQYYSSTTDHSRPQYDLALRMIIYVY
jgi:hypothetical protein